MRRTLLIAAGLTGLLAAPPPARAQFFGWGYYRPYYPVPYGYYPAPYYPPPPYYSPPRRTFPRYVAHRSQRRIRTVRHRVIHRTLVNPLLGPLR